METNLQKKMKRSDLKAWRLSGNSNQNLGWSRKKLIKIGSGKKLTQKNILNFLLYLMCIILIKFLVTLSKKVR
jgi:hypothetical protein